MRNKVLRLPPSVSYHPATSPCPLHAPPIPARGRLTERGRGEVEMIEIKSKIGLESEVALSSACVCVCFCVCSLVPSGSPMNVTAEAVSSTRILLTWSPLPQAQKNGVILGYKVHKTLKYTHTLTDTHIHTQSHPGIFTWPPQPIITSSNTFTHSLTYTDAPRCAHKSLI